MDEIRLALLGSFNLELLVLQLKDAMISSGLKPDIYIGGYNQYPQEFLNSQSGLYHFDPDAVLFLIHWKDVFPEFHNDLLPFILSQEKHREIALERSRVFIHYINTFLTYHKRAHFIINNLYIPPITPLGDLPSHLGLPLTNAIHEFNAEIGEKAKSDDRLFLLDTSSLVMEFGEKEACDPRLWYLARCIWSRSFTRRLGKRVVQLWRAIMGRSKKCLVLDLDNTLWGGIIGEEGVGGIKLGGEGIGFAFKEFQQEIKVLKQRGILLALNSKNNLPDVLEVFNKHPEMILKESDFVVMKVNWKDKVENMREIASELNIGLDSLVFIDDNPMERDLIRNFLPDVCIPDFPLEVSDLNSWFLELCLEHFNIVRLTTEDIQKTEQYIAKKKVEDIKVQTGNMEEFLHSLEMKAILQRLSKVNLPRVAQLTQKTNQFNATTKRYTESDIEALEKSGAGLVFSIQLLDKFSNHGIIGVVIYTKKDLNAETDWMIDTFLLSCRMIGRNVEQVLFNVTADFLKKEKGAGKIFAEFIPTVKNKPAEDLFDKLGFSLISEKEGHTFWEMDISHKNFNIPDYMTLEFMGSEKNVSG